MNTRITLEQMKRLLQDDARERDEHSPERHRRLKERLLFLGGSKVIFQGQELFAGRLLDRGELFTQRIRFRHGDPHRCHTNAAELWAEDVDNHQLVTGYARGRELWAAHSWVVKGRTLLETTSRFQQYYGIVLGPMEAIKFFLENVFKERFPDPSQVPAEFWQSHPQALLLMRQLAGLFVPGAGKGQQRGEAPSRGKTRRKRS